MLHRLKNIGHLANAFLASFFYGFPSRKLTVIGVTGTDGKTTTATLIYHILRSAGKKVALISTVSARIGKKEIDTGFHVTTPSPWALQKLIRKISLKNYQYLVLEATSHGLDQHRLFGINFHIAVLTNITHEHLDYHQTFDNYLKAKAKLFRHAHHAVLNEQDESSTRIKSLLPSKTIVHPCNLKKANDDILKSAKARFPEEFNWSNSLAAATAADILELSTKDICKAIKSFPQIKGRMEQIANKKGIKVFIDFAHTPNALDSALKSLRSMIDNRNSKLIAVYGSAGLRDEAKRPMMGKIGSRLADTVILTAEDPRTEDVNNIISQIKKGSTSKATVYTEPDRQKAIDLAIVKLAQKGDIVAVFGKGHEKSMSFGKIEYPWSDHHAVNKALKKRK